MSHNECMVIRRRDLLAGMSAAAGLTVVRPVTADGLHTRPVPSTGVLMPRVGLGSWLTFDAPPADSRRRQQCFAVMRAFFAAGGTMIDSSPMYGYSQDVIGAGLKYLGQPAQVFAATKVWIPGAATGERQIELARSLWGVPRFDLVHVHNMLDWQAHLPWLLRWREQGQLPHVGISTSHGRRHADMVNVIRTQPLDFVQFTYNIEDREAERQLLPQALQQGKAVVINRPFAGGGLFRRVRGRTLPDWAADMGCSSWAQFFLKFIISHPAVTCAIPATTREDHVSENMAVLTTPLPDEAMRREMVRYFESAN